MIKKSEPLSLIEVKELIKKLPETEKTKEVAVYIKQFIKLKEAEAQKLKKELKELSAPSLNEEQIVKIIDILPADMDDLRKIITEISLNENEITKILDIVKKYL